MEQKLKDLIKKYQEIILQNKRVYNEMYAEDLKDAIKENDVLSKVIEDIKFILQ